MQNSFVRSVVSDGSDGGGGGGGMAVIDGKNHKARFGLAVACIGNLNLDGRSQSLPKGIEVNLHLCDLSIKLAVHLKMCQSGFTTINCRFLAIS